MQRTGRTARDTSHQKRFWRFGLGSLLLVVLFCGGLSFFASEVYQVWQRTSTETLSVKLLASGEIPWENGTLAIEDVQPHLEGIVEMWQSYGMEPLLVIECYSDTRAADIENLMQMGRDAGFTNVATEHPATHRVPQRDRHAASRPCSIHAAD